MAATIVCFFIVAADGWSGRGVGSMSVVLLLLGIVTTVAGLVLVASGIPIREGTFDAEVVTPGTIAAIGGLVLIGMALAVRELKRIERTLAARPMPHIARSEAPAAASTIQTPDTPDASVLIPLPTTRKSDAPSVSAEAHPTADATEDVTFEHARVKFPIPPPAEEAASEVKTAVAASRGRNGAAPVRLAPRLDVVRDGAEGRPAATATSQKTSVFGGFWSRGRDGRTALQAIAPQSPAVAEPAATAESGPKAESSTAQTPVSVLKSGVVDGMAYTLYSDGSIEAQLPQGTMRFGSITALRNHIESGS
jgi:hypothetical protein